MNFYEHTLVAKQDLSGAEVKNIEKKYNDLINSASGKVLKIENWGLMNFKKKIKNYSKGFYIHYKFEGSTNTLDEIKKKILLDASVIRHLTIKYKKLDTTTEYFKEKENNEKK
ncbi:MAG: 30S ribosomal protein S6 [Candidatus Pelagibacter sp. TMED106]|nr:MAG: 30S ribosomal protein S6 [Candidatus Pelagibacter sp. TMED106]